MFDLPGWQKLALDANLPILDAEERLYRTGCRDDEVYDLAIVATGSEEQASAMLTARAAAVLKRGGTPET